MDLSTARKNLFASRTEEVIMALRYIGNKGLLVDLPTIIRISSSAKISTVKREAITACTRLILRNLLTKFNDMKPEYREKLGSIMQALDPSIMDEIARELYSDNDERRLRAVQTLGLLKKNPRIKEILARLVQDRDEKIRATAINLLGKVVGPHDHELIMALLNDSDKRVRANTVEALESLGNKRLVPVLIRFRKDPSNRIRGNVLKALYNLGYTEIEPDLLEMLTTPDNFMKASSYWVISQIGLGGREIEDLAGYDLLSDDEMVARNAANALTAVDSPRARGFLTYLGS